MILSQLGECFEHAADIKKYMTITIQALQHDNPMLRYAALQVIGQFADDLHPSFTE
jgi:hypothetical protein